MQSGTSPEEFRQLVEQITVPGLVCSHGDLDTILRLVAAVMSVLDKKADELVQKFDNQPVMACYQSDGWSACLSDTTTMKLGAKEQRVRREGRYKHEFLLGRGMLRANHLDGRPWLAMCFSAPRALRKGRGSWHMLAAGCEFRPLLRSQGHQGVSTSLYLMDGALFESTMFKWMGIHDLFYHDSFGACESNDPWFL